MDQNGTCVPIETENHKGELLDVVGRPIGYVMPFRLLGISKLHRVRAVVRGSLTRNESRIPGYAERLGPFSIDRVLMKYIIRYVAK